MKLNESQITIVSDTEFRLDGGAMFGVVPRVFWEKVAPPDDLNRIHLNMNCVYVEIGDERILIETGIGEKWTPKETSIYGISRQRPFAETLFGVSGRRADEITIVVNTHLHFDHAGGNTILNDRDEAIAQFPNARYLVSRREYEHAENPNDRDRASYRPDDWRPLVATGQLELMSDDYEVAPGLSMTTVRGHSETMQTWRFESPDGRVYYGFADLIPTTAHLAPAWVMGYDLFPAETVEAKKRLLARAVDEDWTCVFYHDAKVATARIVSDAGKFGIARS